jgi:uncharacterized RDD family membrane protein YckC
VGLWLRLAALFYDLLLLLGLWMLIGFCAVAIHSWMSATPDMQQALAPQAVSGLWFQLLLWVTGILYFALFWCYRGQTPGMSAWRIMVCVTHAHCPPSLFSSVVRAGLAPISALMLGAGYLWCFLPPKHAYWHDIWSGTHVLRLELVPD